MDMNETRQCRRCGTCCEKGGPAMHTEDLARIGSGGLALGDLITIRRGEMAVDPAHNRLVPVKHELVKIRGAKGSWQCCFYDGSRHACTIYEQRPLACRILKCWEPSASLALAGKDLLSRLQIIGKDHPLAELIKIHERRCPCPNLAELDAMSRLPGKTIKSLEKLIGQDLEFRTRTAEQLGLSVEEEMFAFGRPVFHLLGAIGLTTSETPKGLKLSRTASARRPAEIKN